MAMVFGSGAARVLLLSRSIVAASASRFASPNLSSPSVPLGRSLGAMHHFASSTSSDRKEAVLLIQSAVIGGGLREFKKAVELSQVKDEGITETISPVRDKGGNGALHWAAAQGRAHMCKYLIEELGFDVNFVASKNGMTPLMHTFTGPLATFEGSLGDRVSTIRYFLDRGADLAIRNKMGDTALHLAIKRCYARMCSDNTKALELLVSKGGPMDEPNDLSGTPLLMTAFAKSKCLMKILLDHGADPNMVLSDFITPLLISAVNNALDCAKLLIMYGADANKANILYWTVFGSSKEMLNVLLDGGADPNVPNQYGRFPVEVAAIRSYRELVEILFPLTSPIPTVPVWSVEGLFRHVKSASFKREEENLFKRSMQDLKRKIEDALRKKDAFGAMVLCTHALNEDPRDASLYANRSLSYLFSRKSEAAYKDAQLCMGLQPNWPISYLRVGAALRSLKRYKDAMLVLFCGVGLDPSNKDIQNELRLAVKCANKRSRTHK